MAKGFIRERINKDGTHSWDVVVNYKDFSTGKWRQIWKTAASTRKADTLKNKLLGRVGEGSYKKPTKLTVKAYLDDWLSGPVRSTVSPSTHELYKIIVNRHLIPALGQIPLAQLQAQRVQVLYADKLEQGLSPRSVQLQHVCLHKALDNAVITGLIGRNPLDGVSPPKVEHREMRTMTEENVKQFLAEARKGEYYALFFTLLFTGLRRGEALSLRWGDADLLGAQLSINRTMQFINNKITFKQPKTRSSRRQIALSPNTCVCLRLHREEQDAKRKYIGLNPLSSDDLVFCHVDGSPYLPNSITHSWIKLVRRCGLNGIRLHDARHTMATLMLKNGTSPKVIQERLGHSNYSTTMNLYAHVSPGMQKEAVNRFDDAIIGKGNEIALNSH